MPTRHAALTRPSSSTSRLPLAQVNVPTLDVSKLALSPTEAVHATVAHNQSLMTTFDHSAVVTAAKDLSQARPIPALLAAPQVRLLSIMIHREAEVLTLHLTLGTRS